MTFEELKSGDLFELVIHAKNFIRSNNNISMSYYRSSSKYVKCDSNQFININTKSIQIFKNYEDYTYECHRLGKYEDLDQLKAELL